MGSSNLALPSALQNKKCLLDIKKQDVTKCFLYCFITAWHFKYGESLHEKDTRRFLTSPYILKPSSLIAHQRVGDIVMPMVFKEIPTFKKLNKVQANVFMFLNNWLIPHLVSKKDCLLLKNDGKPNASTQYSLMNSNSFYFDFV